MILGVKVSLYQYDYRCSWGMLGCNNTNFGSVGDQLDLADLGFEEANLKIATTSTSEMLLRSQEAVMDVPWVHTGSDTSDTRQLSAGPSCHPVLPARLHDGKLHHFWRLLWSDWCTAHFTRGTLRRPGVGRCNISVADIEQRLNIPRTGCSLYYRHYCSTYIKLL